MVTKKDGSVFFTKDTEASKELKKTFPKMVQKKQCYNNVWRLTMNAYVLLEHKQWRVAYGAVEVGIAPGLFLRHAFFLNTETEEVIDPTIPVSELPVRYLIAETYDMSTYSGAVCDGGATPDFWDNRVFRKVLTPMERWAFESGLAIGG